MRDIHAGVNWGNYPDEDQFNAIIENLIETLNIWKISQSDIEEVMKIVSVIKNDILGLNDGKKEVLPEKHVNSQGIISKGLLKSVTAFKKGLIPRKDAAHGVLKKLDDLVPVVCSGRVLQKDQQIPAGSIVSKGPTKSLLIMSPLISPQQSPLKYV